jgi:hypothetical protein
MFVERRLQLPYSYYANDYRRSYSHILTQASGVDWGASHPPVDRFRFGERDDMCAHRNIGTEPQDTPD